MTSELRVLINQLENINYDIGVSGAYKKFKLMADLIRERTALREQLESILAQEQPPAVAERGIEAALKRLVDLKAHKDAHGKNNWYIKNQKDAWFQANAALSKKKA